MMRISPEQKLLTAVHAEEVFHGNTIRQENPACCGRVIDLFNTAVRFPDIHVGRKSIALLEPRCPSCGRWVKPEYSLVQ